MKRTPHKQTVLLQRPRCPYCAGDKYRKSAGAYNVVEHPNGSVSRLYRVKCAGCLQNFNLREITSGKES